jgi:hypothetical protein
MIVAWQFIARNGRKKGIRPVRVRYGWTDRRSFSNGWLIRGTTSHRTLRDGSVNDSVPGNELPGYDHSVPTGRAVRLNAPIRRFAQTPNAKRQTSSTTCH